jgi:hypothetical protein
MQNCAEWVPLGIALLTVHRLAGNAAHVPHAPQLTNGVWAFGFIFLKDVIRFSDWWWCLCWSDKGWKIIQTPLVCAIFFQGEGDGWYDTSAKHLANLVFVVRPSLFLVDLEKVFHAHSAARLTRSFPLASVVYNGEINPPPTLRAVHPAVESGVFDVDAATRAGGFVVNDLGRSSGRRLRRRSGSNCRNKRLKLA